MRLILLLFLVLFVFSSYAQQEIIELPKFLDYFGKTADTLQFYQKGGSLKGTVKEVSVYEDTYKISSKYFDKNRIETTSTGQKLYKIEVKNDSIQEIYFLNTSSEEVASFRNLDENNYYLGQIITYDTKNRIRSSEKIGVDLSKYIKVYAYNYNNQLLTITKKEFIAQHIVSEYDTEISKVSIPEEADNTRIITAKYNKGLLQKLTTTYSEEFNLINKGYEKNKNITVLTFSYKDQSKVKKVSSESYQVDKKSNKQTSKTIYKEIKLFYHANDTIKETRLSYIDEEEDYTSVITTYNQPLSLANEIIRVTTLTKENEKAVVIDKSIEEYIIKRDTKQNITSFINKNLNIAIAFTHIYY